MVLHVISYQFMKANITLKLDTDVLREARILAAEEGLSVSGLLAAKLDEIVRQRKGYDRFRKRAVARLHKGFELGWTALGTLWAIGFSMILLAGLVFPPPRAVLLVDAAARVLAVRARLDLDGHPEGADDVGVRNRLLNEFNIEIGGGLGPMKGKVWRVGLMGYNSQPANVVYLLYIDPVKNRG